MAFTLPPSLLLFRPRQPLFSSHPHHSPPSRRFRPPSACGPPSSPPSSPSTSILPPPTFCPRCATAVETQIPPDDTHLRQVCPSCHYIIYQNPTPVVGVIPVSKDHTRVLLTKRAIPPKGKWTFPAGFLEMGETTLQGAQREAMEEAGAVVEIEKGGLMAVYDVLVAGQLQVLYWGVVSNEKGCKAGIESLEVQFFEWEKIPWEELAFPTVEWALKFWKERTGSGVDVRAR